MKDYDKPRIASTIILGIFLLVLIGITIPLLPVSWAQLNSAVESAQNSNEGDPAGQVVGGAAAAFVLSIALVLVIGVEIVIFLVNGLGFLFAFKNRMSTLKPIRIISYVYDGLFIALGLTALIKFILLLCGV